MRPPSPKSGSGRVVVALLGLFFLKALGDLAGGSAHTRGRSAEAFEDAAIDAPAMTHARVNPAPSHAHSVVHPATPTESLGTSAPR